MDKKRQMFREDEKARQLVLERKDVVESKKSDMISLMKKKEAWAEIGHIFNSTGLYPERSTVQIKKMWENQKAKRRAQLALEKREVMKTGGGSQSVVIEEDTELDSVGIDIGLRADALDSDTLMMGSNSYAVVDGILVPASVSAHDAGSVRMDDESPVEQEEESVADDLQQGRPLKKGTKSTFKDEIESRIQRNEQFLLQDGELHQLKKAKQQQKVALLEQERMLVEIKINQELEMFELKKTHEIELFEMEKKKKLLEIRKLEEEKQKES